MIDTEQLRQDLRDCLNDQEARQRLQRRINDAPWILLPHLGQVLLDAEEGWLVFAEDQAKVYRTVNRHSLAFAGDSFTGEVSIHPGGLLEHTGNGDVVSVRFAALPRAKVVEEGGLPR